MGVAGGTGVTNKWNLSILPTTFKVTSLEFVSGLLQVQVTSSWDLFERPGNWSFQWSRIIKPCRASVGLEELHTRDPREMDCNVSSYSIWSVWGWVSSVSCDVFVKSRSLKRLAANSTTSRSFSEQLQWNNSVPQRNNCTTSEWPF